MDAGILALSIPIVGILSIAAHNITKTITEHQRRGSPRTDRGEVESLKKRMAEMEQRIMTLQDLVIGGDFEIRRRLEQAQMQAEFNRPQQSSETPQRTMTSLGE